ncbi:MAG: PEP-CTERM sorting domain-containing protein [Planctomycetota bacterium]
MRIFSGALRQAAAVWVCLTVLCGTVLADLAVYDLKFRDNGNFKDHAWLFNEDYSSPALWMNQTAINLGPAQSEITYAILGSTNLHITKTVTNMSGEGWKGYKFKITSGEGEFTGRAYCPQFGFGQVEGDTIIFDGPELPSGGRPVTFDFDVMVTNPEPGTIGLFGLGGAFLRIRRKKIENKRG